MENKPPNAPVKEKRRKLTRVVQKKKKSAANLNTSASVAYYKKVKAALNASLNSSRASQTLKANNKALAQSLQHVKQELRMAINENSRLQVENQELLIKLCRLENLSGFNQEQSNTEKLQKIKDVFNRMSHHLLDLGTCVSDGIDMCVNPRSSSSSHPLSLDNFHTVEDRSPCIITSPKSAVKTSFCEKSLLATVNSTVLASKAGTEFCPHFMLDSLSKTNAALDMSIILEQTMIDIDEGLGSADAHMDTVFEEPAGTRTQQVLTKLPQRVPNEKNLTRSDGEDKSSKKEPVRGNSISAILKDSVSDNADSLKVTVPQCRRDTFVVTRPLEPTNSISGSFEDITNMPMPDLVSASPMKDDQSPDVFDDGDDQKATDFKESVSPIKEPSSKEIRCNSPIPQIQLAPHPVQKSCGQENSSKEQSQHKKLSPAVASSCTKEDKSKKKAEQLSLQVSKEKTTKTIDESKAAKNIQKVTSVSLKEQRRSGGNKDSAVSKSLKTHTGSYTQKETEFFISNPCALNLVHKRVTGSSEGCLDAEGHDTTSKTTSAMESFLAEIRQSNRQSGSSMASFILAENPCNVPKIKPAEKPLCPVATVDVDAEDDRTVFFDSDMEFTAVLPETEILESVAEHQEQLEMPFRSKEASVRDDNAESISKDSTDASKHFNKSAVKVLAENPDDKIKETDAGLGDDKKHAVTMRVNKPGQMVFAASRKEEDGTRKAIPAKLQTKSRSKSKKRIEEIMKNLSQKEPEDIFDFHDKTPCHAGTESKQSSIFDLSLNDTLPGVPSTLASFRQKLSVVDSKPFAPSLLGDATEYKVPLKGDPSDLPESSHSSKERSSSKGRDGRSKSRTNSEEKKNSRSKSKALADQDQSADHLQNQRARSKSRNLSEKEKVGDLSGQAERTEVLRRSARSKSRGRKIYNDGSDDCIDNDSESNKVKNRIVGKDEDDGDTYQHSKSSETAQSRGRSKKRLADGERKIGEKLEQHGEQVASRRRSKSRHRQQEINKCITADDKTSVVATEVHMHTQEKITLSEVLNANEVVEPKSCAGEIEPLIMVTDRRHRSRSTHKKRFNDADRESEPFQLDGVSAAAETPVDIKVHIEIEQKIRSCPKSKTNDEHCASKEIQHLNLQSVTSPDLAEKRKLPQEKSDIMSAERECSPSKRRKPAETSSSTVCTNDKLSDKCSADSRSGRVSGKKVLAEVGSVFASPGKMRRRSSLPVTVPKDSSEEANNVLSSSSPLLVTKNKKASKLPEAKPAEKNNCQYQLQFEEVKKKLKALEAGCASTQGSSPVRKSRPLVLPKSLPAVPSRVSKKFVDRLLPSKDCTSSRNKSSSAAPEHKSQPLNSGAVTENIKSLHNPELRLSSRTNSPHLSTASARTSGEFEDSCQADGRRGRRAAASVCYKEPALNSKLRRGDPISTYIYKEDAIQIHKSPKGHQNYGKSGRLEREVLHDLTNKSHAELDAELSHDLSNFK